MTALMLSIQRGHHDIVSQLLEAGSNAMLRNNNGATAMDIAARRNDIESMKLITDSQGNHKLYIIITVKSIHVKDVLETKIYQDICGRVSSITHVKPILNLNLKRTRQARAYLASAAFASSTSDFSFYNPCLYHAHFFRATF